MHHLTISHRSSIFYVLLLLCSTGGCGDVVNVNQSGTGCAFDSDCSEAEFCNAFGACRPLNAEPDVVTPLPDPTPENVPDAGAFDAGRGATDPSTPAPENNPEPSPAPFDAGSEPDVNDAGRPLGTGSDAGPDAGTIVDAGTTDAGAADAGPQPECTNEQQCGNGRTCIDNACVVGCDGVPTAGTCNAFQLAYCANPGLPNEEVRTASLADPVCFGDVLIDSCGVNGEPQGVDCVALGGDCSLGACIALPEGARCDDDTLQCGTAETGEPMQCAQQNAQGVGVCETGCGDLDYFGECSAGVVRFCADEGLATERIESYACNAGEVCGEMRPGIDGCVGAQGLGATCWNAPQGQTDVSFCGGNNGALACQIDIDTGLGQCIQNSATCDPLGPRQCTGNRLMTFCYQTQPVLIDCSDHGGTCSNSQGACVGIDRFEPCNNDDLICANGLRCYAPGYCDF